LTLRIFGNTNTTQHILIDTAFLVINTTQHNYSAFLAINTTLQTQHNTPWLVLHIFGNQHCNTNTTQLLRIFGNQNYTTQLLRIFGNQHYTTNTTQHIPINSTTQTPRNYYAFLVHFGYTFHYTLLHFYYALLIHFHYTLTTLSLHIFGDSNTTQHILIDTAHFW